MVKLTPKQEAFARKYVECGNATEAYRECYNAGSMSDDVLKVKAYEVKHNGNVAVTILKLQEAATERTLVTVASLTKELEEARKLAESIEQPSAMTGAIMGKAKLAGLDVHKVEHVNPLTIAIAKEDAKL